MAPKEMTKTSRFDYVAYDPKATKDQLKLKKAFQNLEALITSTLTPGRATALALTHLEETYMWVGKSIRDHQLERNTETISRPNVRDA